MKHFILLLFFVFLFHETSNASAAKELDKKEALGHAKTEEDIKQTLSQRYTNYLAEGFQILGQTCVYPKGKGKYVIPSSWIGTQKLVTLPHGVQGNSGEINVRPGVSPYDAVLRFFTKPKTRPHWVLECRLAMEIAQSYALSKILGKDIFDDLYKTKEGPVGQRILFLYKATETTTPFYRIAKPGYSGYITNHCEYPYLIYGVAAGENVSCVGKNKQGELLYMGFGDLYKKGPVTYNDIRKDLIRHLLSSPTRTDIPQLEIEAKMVQMKLQTSFKKNPQEFEAMFDAEQNKNEMTKYKACLNEEAVKKVIAEFEKKKMESTSVAAVTKKQ